MRLITREQAQELDHLAMTKHDISGESLMRNAGQKIAEFVQSQLISIHNPNIGIVSGKGNNGGDGFAAGEFLNNLGFKITVYSLEEKIILLVILNYFMTIVAVIKSRLFMIIIPR